MAADPERALKVAHDCGIPLVQRYSIRRAASDDRLLNDVVAALGSSADVELQQLIAEEVLNAFKGRVDIAMPSAWEATYEKLAGSTDESLRERADEIAVALGDRRIFPRMIKQERLLRLARHRYDRT